MIGGKTRKLNGQIKDKSTPLRPVGRPPKDKRKNEFRLKKFREKVGIIRALAAQFAI